MQPLFFFRVSVPNGRHGPLEAFLVETVETRDNQLDLTKAVHGKA